MFLSTLSHGSTWQCLHEVLPLGSDKVVITSVGLTVGYSRFLSSFLAKRNKQCTEKPELTVRYIPAKPYWEASSRRRPQYSLSGIELGLSSKFPFQSLQPLLGYTPSVLICSPSQQQMHVLLICLAFLGWSCHAPTVCQAILVNGYIKQGNPSTSWSLR